MYINCLRRKRVENNFFPFLSFPFLSFSFLSFPFLRPNLGKFVSSSSNLGKSGIRNLESVEPRHDGTQDSRQIIRHSTSRQREISRNGGAMIRLIRIVAGGREKKGTLARFSPILLRRKFRARDISYSSV